MKYETNLFIERFLYSNKKKDGSGQFTSHHLVWCQHLQLMLILTKKEAVRHSTTFFFWLALVLILVFNYGFRSCLVIYRTFA